MTVFSQNTKLENFSAIFIRHCSLHLSARKNVFWTWIYKPFFWTPVHNLASFSEVFVVNFIIFRYHVSQNMSWLGFCTTIDKRLEWNLYEKRSIVKLSWKEILPTISSRVAKQPAQCFSGNAGQYVPLLKNVKLWIFPKFQTLPGKLVVGSSPWT